MVKTTLKIDGMMCGMCEAHVNDVIRKVVPDAQKVKSSHIKGESTFISEQEIDEQISRLYLGDGSGKILVLIKKIALGEVVRWEEFVQYKEHSAAYEKLEDAEEIYDRISDDGLETANEQIQRDVKELLSMSAAVNATGRRMIRRIALFAKGQILIHKVMPVIGRIYYQKGQPVNKSERYELAAELEHWMYAYKNNWRQDSQESELYRIEEVFYWYADILRS